MKPYLYISLLPEALVASHLDPEAYGAYLATGPKHLSRGTAIFFKLTEAYAETKFADFNIGADLERPEGIHRSAYLSIYRVLEHTPLNAIETLHLTTEDGRVLTLRPAPYEAAPGPRFHLYQQFSPVTPRVVSTLDPLEFGKRITDRAQRVSLPALVFAELKLNRLGDDPEANGIGDLPYPNIEHLRNCLRELRTKTDKNTKTVVRFLQQDVLYRTLRGGFYAASSNGDFISFPMPSREELETTYYPWWRSALSTVGA